VSTDCCRGRLSTMHHHTHDAAYTVVALRIAERPSTLQCIQSQAKIASSFGAHTASGTAGAPVLQWACRLKRPSLRRFFCRRRDLGKADNWPLRPLLRTTHPRLALGKGTTRHWATLRTVSQHRRNDFASWGLAEPDAVARTLAPRSVEVASHQRNTTTQSDERPFDVSSGL